MDISDTRCRLVQDVLLRLRRLVQFVIVRARSFIVPFLHFIWGA